MDFGDGRDSSDFATTIFAFIYHTLHLHVDISVYQLNDDSADLMISGGQDSVGWGGCDAKSG